MSAYSRWLSLILIPLFGMMYVSGHAAFVADSVILYTPNTSISVPPGESISYTIDIINNSKELVILGVTLAGLPEGWDYTLKWGACLGYRRDFNPAGWKVTFKANYVQATSVEIEPNTTKDISVEIDPPDNIKAGTYKIPVYAGNNSTSATAALEIVINRPHRCEGIT